MEDERRMPYARLALSQLFLVVIKPTIGNAKRQDDEGILQDKLNEPPKQTKRCFENLGQATLLLFVLSLIALIAFSVFVRLLVVTIRLFILKFFVILT